MKITHEFKLCPVCQSPDKVMANSVAEAVKDGLLGEGLFPCVSVSVYMTVDPRRPSIAGGRYPAIRVYRDICGGCGYEHVVRVESGYAITSTNPNKPVEFR